MTKDLSKLSKAKRALDDVRLEYEFHERIFNVLHDRDYYLDDDSLTELVDANRKILKVLAMTKGHIEAHIEILKKTK